MTVRWAMAWRPMVSARWAACCCWASLARSAAMTWAAVGPSCAFSSSTMVNCRSAIVVLPVGMLRGRDPLTEPVEGHAAIVLVALPGLVLGRVILGDDLEHPALLLEGDLGHESLVDHALRQAVQLVRYLAHCAPHGSWYRVCACACPSGQSTAPPTALPPRMAARVFMSTFGSRRLMMASCIWPASPRPPLTRNPPKVSASG